jgi:ATP-dependent Zn protease
MVGSLGMAGSLISYNAMEMSGAANVVAKVLSQDDGKEAVDRILNDAKKAVRGMLDEHRHVVEALRDALLDRDELIGEEIVSVVETALEEPRPEAVRPVEAAELPGATVDLRAAEAEAPA